MILRLTNVTKKFGNFTAVDNVSFELQKGERIGLIGGNGAGKTTISEMIAGINKVTSGTIEYGFSFEHSPKEKIGMQFQQSDYPSGLTVKDIIAFARNLRKLKHLSNKDLQELLEVFQMEDFYNRKVRSLSGGQRQKLNILLSIIHNPEIVILDELSTGLDIAAREDIIEFTDQLLQKRNMSSILISHHMAEIRALCDKVIILDRGKIMGIEKIKDIEKKYGSLDAFMKEMIREQNKLSKKPSVIEQAHIDLRAAKKAYHKNKNEQTRADLTAAKINLKLVVRQHHEDEKQRAKIEAQNKKLIKKHKDPIVFEENELTSEDLVKPTKVKKEKLSKDEKKVAKIDSKLAKLGKKNDKPEKQSKPKKEAVKKVVSKKKGKK